jgi:pyruvate/2-oxoglutarate dehydrogenase complex dihydrolipoamide dehydrogenase (E3) component
MVEALAARGLRVTQVEALPEVLPTVDPELGELVRQRIEKAGAEVVTGVAVSSVRREGNLTVEGSAGFRRYVDLVLVVVGVRPDADLARTAGVELGVRGAIAVDRSMRTSVPHLGTALSPIRLLARPICRWGLQRRDASRVRTPPADTGNTRGASAARS